MEDKEGKIRTSFNLQPKAMGHEMIQFENNENVWKYDFLTAKKEEIFYGRTYEMRFIFDENENFILFATQSPALLYIMII